MPQPPITREMVTIFREEMKRRAMPILQSLPEHKVKEYLQVDGHKNDGGHEEFRFLTYLAMTDGNGKRTGECLHFKCPPGLRSQFFQLRVSLMYPKAHDSDATAEDRPTLDDLMGSPPIEDENNDDFEQGPPPRSASPPPRRGKMATLAPPEAGDRETSDFFPPTQALGMSLEELLAAKARDERRNRSMPPKPPVPTLPARHPLTTTEKAALLRVGRYGSIEGGMAWGDLVREINGARHTGRGDERWPSDWPEEVVRGDLFARHGHSLEESEVRGLSVQGPPGFLRKGMVCKFVGLERLSNLNGQTCTIVKKMPYSDRWHVFISSSKESVLVKPENLEPR